jgi:hypothetical protein
MNLIPVLNKSSPQVHTESELDKLGIHGKLVKYEVHSSKEKIEKNYFSSDKLPKKKLTNFWSQGILRIKSQNIQILNNKCLINTFFDGQPISTSFILFYFFI